MPGMDEVAEKNLEATQGETRAADELGEKLDVNTAITEESSENIAALKGEVSESNVNLETSAPTLEELQADLYKLEHPDEKDGKPDKEDEDDKKDESASWLERQGWSASPARAS